MAWKSAAVCLSALSCLSLVPPAGHSLDASTSLSSSSSSSSVDENCHEGRLTVHAPVRLIVAVNSRPPAPVPLLPTDVTKTAAEQKACDALHKFLQDNLPPPPAGSPTPPVASTGPPPPPAPIPVSELPNIQFTGNLAEFEPLYAALRTNSKIYVNPQDVCNLLTSMDGKLLGELSKRLVSPGVAGEPVRETFVDFREWNQLVKFLWEAKYFAGRKIPSLPSIIGLKSVEIAPLGTLRCHIQMNHPHVDSLKFKDSDLNSLYHKTVCMQALWDHGFVLVQELTTTDDATLFNPALTASKVEVTAAKKVPEEVLNTALRKTLEKYPNLITTPILRDFYERTDPSKGTPCTPAELLDLCKRMESSSVPVGDRITKLASFVSKLDGGHSLYPSDLLTPGVGAPTIGLKLTTHKASLSTPPQNPAPTTKTAGNLFLLPLDQLKSGNGALIADTQAECEASLTVGGANSTSVKLTRPFSVADDSALTRILTQIKYHSILDRQRRTTTTTSTNTTTNTTGRPPRLVAVAYSGSDPNNPSMFNVRFCYENDAPTLDPLPDVIKAKVPDLPTDKRLHLAKSLVDQITRLRASGIILSDLTLSNVFVDSNHLGETILINFVEPAATAPPPPGGPPPPPMSPPPTPSKPVTRAEDSKAMKALLNVLDCILAWDPSAPAMPLTPSPSDPYSYKLYSELRNRQGDVSLFLLSSSFASPNPNP